MQLVTVENLRTSSTGGLVGNGRVSFDWFPSLLNNSSDNDKLSFSKFAVCAKPSSPIRLFCATASANLRNASWIEILGSRV